MFHRKPAVGYRKETKQPRPVAQAEHVVAARVEGNYPCARARELPKSRSIAADPALSGRMLAWNMVDPSAGDPDHVPHGGRRIGRLPCRNEDP